MRKVLRIEPYEAAFTLTIGDKARDKFFADIGLGPELSAVNGAVYRLGEPNAAPSFMMFLPESRDEETLYHEALHLATAILDHFGVEISHENDEVMAHLQGYIVRLVDKAVYKRRRTIKKPAVE